MATSFSSKKTSFNKIFIIVFGIAFGLMALAMGFKGVKNTSDIRSRASLETTMVKRWEFNGTTAEGWRSLTTDTVKVAGGKLAFYAKFNAPESGIVYNTPFRIPAGIRNFQMSARIPFISQNEVINLASPTIVAEPVTIEVHFQKKLASSASTKVLYEDLPNSTLRIRGTADGQFHTYTVPFPNTLTAYSVARVSVTFRGEAAPRTQVDVNWIRIVLQKKSPTPTPTPCYCPGYWMECPKGPNRSDVGDIKLCPKPPEEPREFCINNRCPTGYKCSATPPGGCPTTIVNGIEQTTKCATKPQCWPLGPIRIPTCIQKPPCVDGIIDPQTGAKVYCDVKPGTVFCPTTPTPTSLCRVTLSKYSLSEPCGTDVYRYVKYTCSDGYTATQGGSTSCKSASVWKQYASDDCIRRQSSTCITPPSTTYPSPWPSSTGGPVPTWVQYTPTPTASF